MFMGPSDSMANGMKSCVAGRFAYFARLRSAACSAAPPVVEAVRWIYEDAHVGIAVASHATYLPLDHGISVAPSGLLPSVRIRPGGSLELGMPAFERALQMMSLMAACRAALPTDLLHVSAWCPPWSATSPHWHRCGAQRVNPRRNPAATPTASLSSPNPQTVNGMVCNQTPACGAISARSLAWPSGSLHPFHTIALSWSISGLSQSICCSGIGSITVGSESLRDCNISSLYVSIHSSAPRMVPTSKTVDAADAK